jgi:hypothetical protein
LIKVKNVSLERISIINLNHYVIVLGKNGTKFSYHGAIIGAMTISITALYLTTLSIIIRKCNIDQNGCQHNIAKIQNSL